jgi:hypothetical protein
VWSTSGIIGWRPADLCSFKLWAIISLITTLTHRHRWQPDVGLVPQLIPHLRRNLNFKATPIYSTPTSWQPHPQFVALCPRDLNSLWFTRGMLSSAESGIVCLWLIPEMFVEPLSSKKSATISNRNLSHSLKRTPLREHAS